MEKLTLKSSGFKDGGMIPAKYTCDGENVNPLLEIRNVPEGTMSLALVVDDPDATGGGVWDHWVVWNIEPGTQYILEDNIPHGAIQGKTSFGSRRYGGPCPSKGSGTHGYRFKLYALDMMLDLSDEAGKDALEREMQEHILAEATLTGLYKKD